MSHVRYDSHGFQVRFTADGDDVPTILELAPLLADRGRRRREQIDQFVASLTSVAGVPRTWAQARPLLRPVLRGGTPGSSLRRPVLPFLSEFVVIDQPDTMTYVGPDQPAAWGVSADEVFAAARANLSGAALHGVATEPVVVRFVDDGDAYWTSHLLLEHWLGRLAGQVGGTPVAFAPERGTLLVTADGSDHLRGLFAQAEEIYAKTSRPISPMAYASDANGCTIPYAAPPGHPLHHTVQRAERVLAVEEYARQAARLTEAQQRRARTDGERDPAAAPNGKQAEPRSGGQAEPRSSGQAEPRSSGQVEPPSGGEPALHHGEQAEPRAGGWAEPGSSGDGLGLPGSVAELVLVGSDEHGWRTRAIWERNEPVLLPSADEVQIGDDVRPWSELAARLDVVPGMDPPRWSAPAWPAA